MSRSQNQSSKYLLMIYTGSGKGKTTAAAGQALRALGHGSRVYMIHFLKGRDYGEFLAAQKLPGLDVEKAGRDTFVKRGEPDPVDVKMAQEGWNRACQALESGKYQLVILDELNIALSYGLLSLEEVLPRLNPGKYKCDIIVTGREAPEELINAADLVSEVKEIKHHFQQGIQSRRGIEY